MALFVPFGPIENMSRKLLILRRFTVPYEEWHGWRPFCFCILRYETV